MGYRSAQYAINQGSTVRQVGYSVRPMPGAQTAPALLSVRVTPAVAAADGIRLRSEHRLTLALPCDVLAVAKMIAACGGAVSRYDTIWLATAAVDMRATASIDCRRTYNKRWDVRLAPVLPTCLPTAVVRD